MGHVSVTCKHCPLAPDPLCFAIGDEWDPGSALWHSGCERTLWNDLWGLQMLRMLWGRWACLSNVSGAENPPHLLKPLGKGFSSTTTAGKIRMKPPPKAQCLHLPWGTLFCPFQPSAGPVFASGLCCCCQFCFLCYQQNIWAFHIK